MNTEKVKIPLLEAAKWILVVILLVFLVSQFSGAKESQTEFDAMRSSITSAADLSIMQEADNQMLRRLYGLDPANYEGYMLYTPTTNMGAEELLVIKLTDVSQQEAVVAAIEARRETQMKSFEGYAQTQYEMVQNAVVEVQGNYILFISAADPAPVRQAFLDAL